jgi:uncharacterized membrane protein YbhN (UPF0104 family)
VNGRWRYGVIGLAIGLAAIVVASMGLGISLREVVARLVHMPLLPLVIASAGGLVLLALQAFRWWIVMRPVVPLRYPQAYAALAVGFMCNVVLPARGGDLVRVQYLGKKTGVSRAKILGTELVDFWSDKWGWIAAFPLLCLTAPPPAWLYKALVVLGAVVVGVAAVLALMASRRGRGRGPAWLANLRDGFAANHWKRLLLVETLIAPLPWLWETAVILVTARAFGLPLTPMHAFAVLTAFNVATVVPSPGNAGSFEAGGTLALALVGVPRDSALAFLFAYHMTQVLPGVLLGAAILTFDGLALFGPRSVLRAEEPAAVVAPETA